MHTDPMPTDPRGRLLAHLQTALELEHATIPIYLTALYSIKDGHNAEAREVIQSVVMEEMLHLTLVANVMNALGGSPRIDSADFVPDYPCPLPHSAGTFEVGLLPLSKAALETFVRIERPAPPHAPPEADRYHTIGQFYEALVQEMERLEEEARSHGKTIFTGPRERQVEPHHFYYGGGGEVIVVTTGLDTKPSPLDTARAALDEVMEQGEGLDHTIFDGDTRFGQMDELAHYFRFNEILVGRYYQDADTPASGPTGPTFPVDWTGVWNVAPNPKEARYRDRPEIHQKMVEFNRIYTRLLGTLQLAFNGAPDRLSDAVPTMYELRTAAQSLVRIPTGDGSTTVGPSFEYQTD